VRPGGCADSQTKRAEIIEQLKAEKGFIELKVLELVKEECARHTDVGCEINEMVTAGKDVTCDIDAQIVKMLKRIIFSGLDCRDKFILSEFPETIAQAEHFEKECTKISAVIFAAGGEESSRIEIIGNNLQN